MIRGAAQSHGSANGGTGRPFRFGLRGLDRFVIHAFQDRLAVPCPFPTGEEPAPARSARPGLTNPSCCRGNGHPVLQ